MKGAPPWRTWPWITVTLVAVAAWGGSDADRAAALEYDRAAIGAGDYWRVLTGQLVHWSVRMAVFDLGAVLLLGGALEMRARRVLVSATVLGFLVVGGGLYLSMPELALYRGTSGLASALMVALALDLLLRPAGQAVAWLGGAVLVLFALKLGWEVWTGRAWLPGTLPPGIAVVPVAHLLGGMVGAAASLALGASATPDAG